MQKKYIDSGGIWYIVFPNSNDKEFGLGRFYQTLLLKWQANQALQKLNKPKCWKDTINILKMIPGQTKAVRRRWSLKETKNSRHSHSD